MPTKKTDVKISIITPVYNVEKYLKKCVQSVLNQSLKEIELILIDDGSADASWKLVQEFVKKDKRVTAIQQENAGAAAARNRGLEIARGEYIGFVDSDDWIDPNYFEELYATATSTKSDIVCAYVDTDVSNLSKNGKFSVTVDEYNNLYNVRMKNLVRENKLHLEFVIWLNIYKRSMLDEHNVRFVPAIRTGQDSVFNMHASYYANAVSIVETPVYYHMNRRDGSLMTNYSFTPEGLKSRAGVFQEIVRFLNSVDEYDKEVYKRRVYSVLNFIYSRLVKTPTLSKSDCDEIGGVLVSSWAAVQHKDEIMVKFGRSRRFARSLSSTNEFTRYVRRFIPIKRALGRVEAKRKQAAGKIRGNDTAYKVLRPPVHAARKVNRLIDKLLS